MKKQKETSYADMLSKAELYEEFHKIVNSHWGPEAKEEAVMLLTENEVAILTRILELHLLNLEDSELAEMARKIKSFGPYQKN